MLPLALRSHAQRLFLVALTGTVLLLTSGAVDADPRAAGQNASPTQAVPSLKPHAATTPGPVLESSAPVVPDPHLDTPHRNLVTSTRLQPLSIAEGLDDLPLPPLLALEPDQARQRIRYGHATGHINPPDEQEFWLIPADYGELLIIRVTRQSDNLDGWLSLYDGDFRHEIAYDDDSGGSRNPQIVYTAEDTQDYGIRVSSWNWRSSGQYLLEVWWYEASGGGPGVTPPPEPEPTATSSTSRCPAGVLHPATTVTGYASAAAPDIYCLDRDDGNHYTVRMNAPGSSAIDTFLRVRSGNFTYEDDDSGYSRNSFLQFFHEGFSTPEIIASAYGNTSGSYAMRIEIGQQCGYHDVNRDNAVNTFDYAMMLDSIGQPAPDSSPLRHLDMNLDGFLNSIDWTIFIMEFEDVVGTTC